MNVKAPISLIVWILLCYFLLRIHFVFAPWRDGRVIAYDPAGYYLPLPATFIYDDLDQFAFYDSIATKYNIGDAVSHTFPVPNGNKCLKYSLGMAVLYSPGFLLGHFLASGDEYLSDGYSKPYYWALSVWSLLFTFIGLFYLRKTLLRYFSDLAVGLGLATLLFATNYLIYAGLNNLMSHCFLFSLYAILIFHSDQWHRLPNWRSSLGIGVSIGLLALSRPTEIIAFLIPLLWGIGARRSIAEQLSRFAVHWPKLLLTAIIIGVIGSVQLIYWKTFTGNWLFYSYNDQGFDFLSPHIWDGLFSFRKGWLIYTPIMIFGLIGFYHLYQKDKGLFWPFLIFTILNIYIVFSWQIWWYGGSVGARAMVQSYAVLVFPMLAFFEWINQPIRKTYLKVVLGAILVLCIDLNLMMTWQSHASGGPWHAEYMTQKYFFAIVGRGVPRRDAKKFLDVKHELKSGKGERQKVFSYQFDSEQDSIELGNVTDLFYSGSRSMKLSKQGKKQISYTLNLKDIGVTPASWIRCRAKVFYKNREWNEWQMARLKLKFVRDGVVHSSPSIRLQWLDSQWKWFTASFEEPVDEVFNEIRPGDQLQILVENKDSPQEIWIDNLELEVINF